MERGRGPLALRATSCLRLLLPFARRAGDGGAGGGGSGGLDARSEADVENFIQEAAESILRAGETGGSTRASGGGAPLGTISGRSVRVPLLPPRWHREGRRRLPAARAHRVNRLKVHGQLLPLRCAAAPARSQFPRRSSPSAPASGTSACPRCSAGPRATPWIVRGAAGAGPRSDSTVFKRPKSATKGVQASLMSTFPHLRSPARAGRGAEELVTKARPLCRRNLPFSVKRICLLRRGSAGGGAAAHGGRWWASGRGAGTPAPPPRRTLWRGAATGAGRRPAARPAYAPPQSSEGRP